MKKISSLICLALTGALVGLAGGAIAQTSVQQSVQLTPAEAAQRFREGENLERKRDLRGAFDAYLAAGEAGDGHAQKKLGDLYSAGNRVVERDYESALRWYHKARAQGIEIPAPFTYPATPVVSLPR